MLCFRQISGNFSPDFFHQVDRGFSFNFRLQPPKGGLQFQTQFLAFGDQWRFHHLVGQISVEGRFIGLLGFAGPIVGQTLIQQSEDLVKNLAGGFGFALSGFHNARIRYPRGKFYVFVGKRANVISDIPQLFFRKLVRPAHHGGVGDADIDDLKIVVRFGKLIAGELRVGQHRRFGVQLRGQRTVPLTGQSVTDFAVVQIKLTALFQRNRFGGCLAQLNIEFLQQAGIDFIHRRLDDAGVFFVFNVLYQNRKGLAERVTGR